MPPEGIASAHEETMALIVETVYMHKQQQTCNRVAWVYHFPHGFIIFCGSVVVTILIAVSTIIAMCIVSSGSAQTITFLSTRQRTEPNQSAPNCTIPAELSSASALAHTYRDYGEEGRGVYNRETNAANRN